jgi:hypothetical protein
MLKIKNKHNGIIVTATISYRKNDKIVKFSGVSIKIDSNNFKKNWEII